MSAELRLRARVLARLGRRVVGVGPRRRFKTARDVMCVVVVIISVPVASCGFDDLGTHPGITRRGVLASGLDSVLKNELGIRDGVDAVLTPKARGGETVREWLRTGSTLEDEPACRASNHFHNPLLPFPNSGVSDQPGFIRLRCSLSEFNQTVSNVIWGTGFISPTDKGAATGNRFDWDAARVAYLNALTLRDPSDREAALAQTFETLGHVMHLVQDLAVPAHVRNDFQSHLQYCAPSLASFARWCENGFERFVRRRPDLVDNAGGLAPDVGDQRLTRFWDGDQFTGTNPSADLTQGLAEYTNANFASHYTIFTESAGPTDPHAFPYPRESSTNLSELLSRRLVARQVTAEDGVVDTGLYLGKVADGEVIEHFLKIGYLAPYVLDQPEPRPPLRLTFQLDDVVHADYAAKLLPRAIGYSGALLDYFFRGRLDVDLIPADPDDPSIVRLSGTNGSTEALGGGTLTLYADDPVTGVRSRAALLDQDLGVTTARGAPVESGRFRVPEEAERFVAVYQGRLGQEEPAANFPGGVIGKVLGGVRVEEVFSDDTRWKLRTPRGVFLLPLTVAEFEEVRWGDGDNILVARTPFGPVGQAARNRVVVYEVRRQPGSVELVTVATADGPEVGLTRKDEADFPFGMSLDTTVNFSQTIRYRQRLAKIDPHRILWQWVPRPPFRPQDGTYEFAGEELGTLSVETAIAEELHFSERFPIALDLEHHSILGTLYQPYVWEVQEVAADASGRLLAVIVVYLTSPQSPGVTLPFFGVNPQGALEVVSQVWLGPSFPASVDRLLWAIVDLKTGEVVASTADRVIALAFDEVSDALPQIYVRGSLEFIGGPTPSFQEIPWNTSGFGPVDSSRPTSVDAELETRQGLLGLALTGWVKAELASSGLFDVQLGVRQSAEEFTYDCGADATLTFFCRAVGVSSSIGLATRTPAQLRDARRSRPAPGGERLVFLATGSAGLDPGAAVIAWDPGRPSAQVRYRTGADFNLLGPATNAIALLTSFGLDEFNRFGISSVVVPLEGPRGPSLFPNEGLGDSFALLAPTFLYNVGDLKFYRSTPPLQRTALPAPLVEVPGNPVGDYHAIRLP